MPRPFATKSGSYYMNVKVKTALRESARGRTVTLPVGDSNATMTVTDKVFVSLRTKDPETAKTRFRLAAHALDQYFDALTKGPQPLTRSQRTALVGDIYREAVRDLDADDSFLDAIEATSTKFDANVAHHLGKTDDEIAVEGICASKPADEKTAELMAAIDMYDARALAAWRAKYETDPAKPAIALKQLYGRSSTTRSPASRSSLTKVPTSHARSDGPGRLRVR